HSRSEWHFRAQPLNPGQLVAIQGFNVSCGGLVTILIVPGSAAICPWVVAPSGTGSLRWPGRAPTGLPAWWRHRDWAATALPGSPLPWSALPSRPCLRLPRHPLTPHWPATPPALRRVVAPTTGTVARAVSPAAVPPGRAARLPDACPPPGTTPCR